MEKLLNIAMLGNMLTRSSGLRRVMPGMVKTVLKAVLLSIVAAILGGMLLSAAFYGAYVTLSHQMDPNMAMILVVCVAFATVLILLSLATLQVQKLSKIALTLAPQDVPVLSHVSTVVDAFMDGFKATNTNARMRN